MAGTSIVLRVGLTLLCSLALISGHVSAENPAPMLRAGAATSNITPWLGISISGSMRDIVATHIHDELHVRCLVIDNGSSAVAIAVVDSCMVPQAIVDDAKALVAARTGIAPSHQLISATHTHSAACATPIFQSDADPDYQRFLASRIADGITRAHTQLAPAQIAWGSAELAEEVFNRRWFVGPALTPPNPFGVETDQVWMNPPRASEHLIEAAGPVDPAIAFVALQTPEGQPVALLANYGLHYVGGTGPGHVSADYFALFAAAMEKHLGAQGQSPPFVTMMSNGSSGDVNNINFREAPSPMPPYGQMRHVADRAAERVYEALRESLYQEWVRLDGMVETLALGVRKGTPEEVAEARARLEAHEGGPLSALPDIYARETVLLDAYPESVSVPVQVLRLGELAITAIPCEVFAEIGLEIKAESPFAQTFTISLANGYYGYLPTERHHTLGGYETWRARSSFLEVTAARSITDRLLEMLENLRR